ncbi:hypothetical protein SRHO_G00016900 [Serrasalmus rhombeus]
MASLYQRFTGKINTSKSFPHPPEASHLLGGQVEGEEKAGKAPQPATDGRVRAQYRKRNACEDEDPPNSHPIPERVLHTWTLSPVPGRDAPTQELWADVGRHSFQDVRVKPCFTVL